MPESVLHHVFSHGDPCARFEARRRWWQFYRIKRSCLHMLKRTFWIKLQDTATIGYPDGSLFSSSLRTQVDRMPQ